MIHKINSPRKEEKLTSPRENKEKHSPRKEIKVKEKKLDERELLELLANIQKDYNEKSKEYNQLKTKTDEDYKKMNKEISDLKQDLKVRNEEIVDLKEENEILKDNYERIKEKLTKEEKTRLDKEFSIEELKKDIENYKIRYQKMVHNYEQIKNKKE
jgi:cell division protein ZapA